VFVGVRLKAGAAGSFSSLMPPFVLGPLRRPGGTWRRLAICGRYLVPWVAPLVLAGCPQLMDDEFEVSASQPSTPGAAGGSSANVLGSSGSGGSGNQAGTGAGPAASDDALCADGLMSGSELGIDCGGDCQPCGCDGTFGEPELITGLGLTGKLWGPTPSRDNRTLYFSLAVDDRENIYQATRSDRGSAFNAATPLGSMNSTELDGTPFLTPDGLTFYLFSLRSGGPGGRDLWMATRQSSTSDFSTPVLVQGVNTDKLEYLPWLSPDGLGLFFVSTRGGGQGASDIWLARRPTLTDPFTTVTNVSELNTSSRDEGITLSRDGLTAIFASNRSGGDVDLWLAPRPSLDSPFSEPANLSEVNSTADDSDPRLSTDGHELFFSSSRNGSQLLWHAWRDCP
jgi:Tol biopolymer transport system component